MRIPSRFMPKAPNREISKYGFALLIIFLAVLFGFVFWQAPFWGISLSTASILLVVFSYFRVRSAKRSFLKFAQNRPGDSICTFTRSFDTHAVDTWIIRAVYEELQAELRQFHPTLPIRADDRLLDDLHIDDEDLDLDVVPVIAKRTGRTLANLQSNPYFGKVNTVADLVHFFNAQPSSDAA